jgi:hypothetical protein
VPAEAEDSLDSYCLHLSGNVEKVAKAAAAASDIASLLYRIVTVFSYL